MISLKGLSYRYSTSETWALYQIDLTISLGEFVVVTGPSGCGKSTLALALGGYLFQQYDGETEGQITISGMDVRGTPVYEIADQVGLVQQNPESQFCTLTVIDEIAFGLENRCLPRDEILARIQWALDVVGACELLDRELATLSGGEKQKVAIAAVMAAKPQVLIFDEPTSNLDPAATAEIFDVIARLREDNQITVIVIEHKVQYLADFNPRLLRLVDGRLVEDRKLQITDSGYPQWEERLQPNVPTGVEPLVEVKNLHTGYGGEVILKDVSMQFFPGEWVSVMGDNGSGKTTFLLSLVGLLKPFRGQIRILGNDSGQTKISQQARQVGLIFQNPEHQLFTNSVWEEAIFAPRNFDLLDEEIEAEAKAYLQRYGLGGREDDHPYRLSYGEKRRLNLISILTYRPRILLLDEIYIGQDPENLTLLLEMLRTYVDAGGVVISVNHHPEVTRQAANRLIFFEGGRILVDAAVDQGFDQLAALGKSFYLPLGVRAGVPT
jgi:energy-coupling factor transporter ATP-binding protein EcfA2